MTDKKIVIGALSGWQMHDRRTRVRKTFLPDVARYGMEYLFLIGGGPEVKKPVLDHDMLVLPVPDAYETLPQRTRAWCKWLLENREFDLALKIDDDSAVSIPRLHRFVQNVVGSYTGLEYHPEATWHSGGAGYLLDRKAVEIIAEQMVEETGPEDLIVSVYMHRNGIPTGYMRQTMDQNFYSGNPRIPTPLNDLIVAHASHHETWLSDKIWFEIWKNAR